ncbi:MAG: hypothetical protein HQ538_01390 [Parcubacteria group bacterium]|nr:hypothetical protein [Parcubacteria group bacterium]
MLLKILVKNLETGHYEKVRIDTSKDTNYQKPVEKMIVKLEKQLEDPLPMSKEEWNGVSKQFESLTGNKL